MLPVASYLLTYLLTYLHTYLPSFVVMSCAELDCAIAEDEFGSAL